MEVQNNIPCNPLPPVS